MTPSAIKPHHERRRDYATLDVCRCPDLVCRVHSWTGRRRLVLARLRLPPAKLCGALRMHARRPELRRALRLRECGSDVLCARRNRGVRRDPDLLRSVGTELLRPRRSVRLRTGRTKLLRPGRSGMLQCRPELCRSDGMRHLRHRLHADSHLLCSEEEKLPGPDVGSRKA
ncbi:MAG: hypothetical protein M3552_12540 [Planctomycetota bacterium]|nr:hypothetical protein [Planctomycetota bacterium]